jgi:hypothetical protein
LITLRLYGALAVVANGNRIYDARKFGSRAMANANCHRVGGLPH